MPSWSFARESLSSARLNSLDTKKYLNGEGPFKKASSTGAPWQSHHGLVANWHSCRADGTFAQEPF